MTEVVHLDAPTQKEVAAKRAWQAALQGLGIDIAVGIALLIIAQFDTITTKEGLVLFLATLGKTVVITAAQYVVRRYVDRSGFNAAGEPVAEVIPRRAAE